jgi:hypothetical protein
MDDHMIRLPWRRSIDTIQNGHNGNGLVSDTIGRSSFKNSYRLSYLGKEFPERRKFFNWRINLPTALTTQRFVFVMR